MTNSTPTVPAVPPVNGRTVVAGAGLSNTTIAALAVIVCGLAEALGLIFHASPELQAAIHAITGSVIAALAVLGYQTAQRVNMQVNKVQMETRSLDSSRVADLEARLSRVEAMVSPERAPHG